MQAQINQWFNRQGPPNYIINNPYTGSLILAGFFYLFAIMYHPVGAHPGRFLGFGATMVVYSIIATLGGLAMMVFLKSRDYYSDKKNWTLFKELSSIVLTLLALGIAGFFAGFLVEEPAGRWNLQTISDSVIRVFMVGVIPFLFFTAMNFRNWLLGEQTIQIIQSPRGKEEPLEEPIQIDSQLKNENLSFFPGEFIYAESEGNYVNFFLYQKEKIRHVVIRNSISNIEQQLSEFPYIFRTHRAFIVNLKKVRLKKGNALGYQLSLMGTDRQIPVARNNTREFNIRLKQFSD